VGAVVAVLAAIVFVNLGLWQLRRLDERRERNAVVEERIDTAAVDLAALETTLPPETLEYRRASAAGTYATNEEVLLRNRSRRGASGFHVLTPLVLDDGRAVIVDRGWVPLDVEGPPVPGAEPPAGRVTVLGYIALGGEDSGDGVALRLSAVDLARLDAQTTGALLPVYLELIDDGADGSLPLSLEPPELSEGPHLGYAVQWFVFAAIAVVGFIVLVVRTGTDPVHRSPISRPDPT
jgi:surfeit locus 1 family protein